MERARQRRNVLRQNGHSALIQPSDIGTILRVMLWLVRIGLDVPVVIEYIEYVSNLILGYRIA